MPERNIDVGALEKLEERRPMPISEEVLSQPIEEITVYYPEQLFSPIPYNSFRCGNLFYRTFVQPNETTQDAYKRAWKYLTNQVREQYEEVKKDFWERQKSMKM